MHEHDHGQPVSLDQVMLIATAQVAAATRAMAAGGQQTAMITASAAPHAHGGGGRAGNLGQP